MLSISSFFTSSNRPFRHPQDSNRYLKCGLLILNLLSLTALAEHQQWPMADEVAILHEIPVLHTAFVQIGEELHYLDNQMNPESTNDLSGFQGDGGDNKKSISKPTVASQKTYNVLKMAGKGTLSLEMDPPMLDFGENSVGSAQKRKIYVRNMKNYDIALDAIVVNSIEFQASFFENFKLEPFKTASVEVVFLPRDIGKRTTSIHFYTSDGIFSYKATGECVSNPYRISPFVGIKVPLKGSTTKSISLHNPHPYTMRVIEMASSGGNCHIELPHEIDSTVAEEPPQYWDIRPFQTKKLANAVLVGGMTENSTVFIRIASQLHYSNDKVVPIDDVIITIPVEISSQKGVYAVDEILDFGLMRHGERSNPLMFTVMQYQLGGRLEFETLYVEKGHHIGIYMEFPTNPPIVVHPAATNDMIPGPKSDLVKVYFDASRIEYPPGIPKFGRYSGEIIAISRGRNYNATIPFKVEVFQGDLETVGNDLALQEDTRPPHQRVVRVRSNLPFGVAVWNISLSSDASPHFSVRLLDQVVSIRAGDIAPVFVLKYNKKVPPTFDNALLYLHTNVSTFKMKIQKYVGKMKIELTSVEKESFDFGFVERNDTRTIRFIVWNNNPAEMKLLRLEVPSRDAYRLYEVELQKKGSVFSDMSNDERVEYVEASDVDIPPMSGKIFDLELKVPQDGIVRKGKMLFETSLESKVFMVTYQVSTGSLQSIPEEISFGQTFPARVVYRTLQVFNSFDEDMTITRLTTLNQDPRFFFEGFDANQPPVLRSGRLTNLGRVMFSPQIPCEHDSCYLGFPLNSHDGQWFTHGFTLPQNLAEVDSYLYKKQRAKFEEMVKSGKNRVNTTIILDTDKAKNIKIKTSAELVWPRLLANNSVDFPLTAMGNFTIVNLTLANPTSVPIAIQIIPLVIYPESETLVDLFRPHLLTPLTDHPNLKVEKNETLMFSLRDTELFSLRKDSPIPVLREELEAGIPHSVPRFTLSMILKPFMKVRLRIGFLPSDLTLRSSLLLIRNNLTVMEPVVMYGKGARNEMKVENVEARSKNPLMFEIRHDHLTDCNNPKRLMHKLHSTLTVRRPFQVLNSGEVEFLVTNMTINGVPCENRGFRILNCYPFKLEPNGTYSLEIAYTPDFLTTTNEADLQLYMHMNGSAWIFPLAATVPPDMMAKCHQALPRPPFENIMYYSCVTALIFCLVCVLACAYLEGDRTIACAIRQQFTAPRHIFDLNNLALQQHQQQQQKELKEKKSKNDTWSILRYPSDSWLVRRILVNIANRIVQCVHSVWKWSLFYRKVEKPAVAKVVKPKKKKNPISMVKREEEAGTNNNNTATVKTNAKVPPMNTKVAPTPPTPPTPPQPSKTAEKKKAPEPKKSRDSSRHSGKSNKKKPVVVNKPVQPESEPLPVPVPQEPVLVQPVLVPQVSLPTPNIPPPSDTLWSTPAAQTAMQYMNMWNYGQPLTVEQMQMLIGQVGGQPTQVDMGLVDMNLVESRESMLTPTPSEMVAGWIDGGVNANQRDGDEDDDRGSVGTVATEDAPDWADEVVNASDAEADFSALADATNMILMTDDEQDDVKLGKQRKKGGDRRRRSPSLASSTASSTLSKRLENSPQKLQGRRLTIGSEKKDLKKNDFSRTPGPIRPPTGLQTEPESFWTPSNDSTFSSMLNFGAGSGTGSGSGPTGGSSIWNSSNNDNSGAPGRQDPLSLSGMGLNLGGLEGTSTEFGNTMFTGREFNLWSDSTFDPMTAWANLGLNTKNENQEGDEKKKD